MYKWNNSHNSQLVSIDIKMIFKDLPYINEISSHIMTLPSDIEMKVMGNMQDLYITHRYIWHDLSILYKI